MKNVFKKLAAAAMAFTLLGSGSAIIKDIAPQTDNSITASAACNHAGYRRYEGASSGWVTTSFIYGYRKVNGVWVYKKVGENQRRTVYIYCAGCASQVSQYNQTRAIYY